MMSAESIPEVMTVMQMAAVLQIGRNNAYALVKSGMIRSIRIGRTIRVPRSALLEYLEKAA